ncbi:MAG: hypothetical protein RLZZ273_918, partial [Bacteroidota bacterium]
MPCKQRYCFVAIVRFARVFVCALLLAGGIIAESVDLH